MRASFCFFLLAYVVVPFCPVQAQQPPQRDPQALAILAQTYALAAGPANPVQDSLADGTVTYADGRSGTIIFKTKGQDKLRHESTVGARTSVLVVDKGRGQFEEQGQKRQLPYWVTAYQRPLHILAISRLGDFLKANTNVFYLGQTIVGGVPTHRIRFTAMASSPLVSQEAEEVLSDYEVYIDVQSLLPVKTITYDFSPDVIENRTAVETYYGDYRLVQGIPVPFRISRFIAGQKQMEFILTGVRFNVGLSDNEFK